MGNTALEMGEEVAAVKFGRASGILLHPASLPGGLGIGTLGSGARRFVDYIVAAGQRIWQVLPLGPTGYGDSPYQFFSAFAGNPLLISLEALVDQDLLSPGDLQAAPPFPEGTVDYGRVIEFKLPLLEKAFIAFRGRASSDRRYEFEEFCRRNDPWLEDFAFFMAAKDAHGGAAWTTWEPSIAARVPAAREKWRRELAGEIESHKFRQYLFFAQWEALKQYCHERGIRIMGDIPLYAAHDSADVWAHRELFHLLPDGNPRLVAGVPPDYFSATGQLWGNPIYRWDVMAQSGYKWWIERFRSTFSLVDIVRMDHFRGLEAYWEVPGSATTAVGGRWVKGPGAALFDCVREALGDLPIVAENLGVITPEVEALRNRFGFPGMAILQFAFGRDPQGPAFRPHNYPRNLVVYTGTHDNDTVVGWWGSTGAGDSTRTPEDVVREKEFARRYLNTDGREIHWVLIRAVLGSVADLAIIPMQDVLGLGSEARMNIPATRTGNWRWRCTAAMLTGEIRDRLKELAAMYDR
jgi:4-alpha-glucanotransferase